AGLDRVGHRRGPAAAAAAGADGAGLPGHPAGRAPAPPRRRGLAAARLPVTKAEASGYTLESHSGTAGPARTGGPSRYGQEADSWQRRHRDRAGGPGPIPG